MKQQSPESGIESGPHIRGIAQVLVAAAALLAAASLAAPVARISGWHRIAGHLYALLSIFCHQMPSRSLWLLGAPTGMCSRSLSVCGAFAIAGFFMLRRRRSLSWPMSGLLLVPILLDALTQSAGWRESTNSLRMLTGTFGGVGLAGLALRWGSGTSRKESAASREPFRRVLTGPCLVGLLVLLLLGVGVSEIRGQTGSGSVTLPDRTMCEEYARASMEAARPKETSEGGFVPTHPAFCLLGAPLIAAEAVKEGLKSQELERNAQEAGRHECLFLTPRVGSDDPEAARNLHNLATRHTDLGEQLQKMAKDNIATARRNAELRAASEPLFKRAEVEQSLGLTMWKNAELLYRQALAVQEKTPEPRHLDTATTLASYADLLRKMDRSAEAGEMEARAESVYKQVLAIQEKTLGPGHLYVAMTLGSYADLLRKMNRGTEAGEMEARAKAIREEARRVWDERIDQLMVGVEAQVRERLSGSKRSQGLGYYVQQGRVIGVTASVRSRLAGLATDQLAAMTERDVRELIDQVIKDYGY